MLIRLRCNVAIMPLCRDAHTEKHYNIMLFLCCCVDNVSYRQNQPFHTSPGNNISFIHPLSLHGCSLLNLIFPLLPVSNLHWIDYDSNWDKCEYHTDCVIYLCRALSNEPHPTTVWASGNDNTWGTLKHGFTGITPYYSKLSERGATWVGEGL